jgi:phage tail tape-measure protein
MSNHNEKDKAVGTAGGAVAGAAAGAALGTLIPGVGNVVGAVIGGAVGVATGAAAGNLIASKINPEAEDKYWEQNYSTRPYASQSSYDEYQPAYKYGWETRGQYSVDKKFSDVETDLGSKWETSKGKSSLGWDKAKHASRDAWDRIERTLPGDFDKDGK